ncbi:MAG: DUF4157 domain-containing protein [Chloroflexi bacterium]|nr:DUF4157 domain-containing protein [Chloroflexota bacterium]
MMDAQHADKDLQAKIARKREAESESRTPQHALVELQRTVGNRGVQRLLAQRKITPAPTGIQAKLTVGPPDDVYEQEADQVAHQVMTMPIQREMPPEDEELAMKRVQREMPPEDEELAMKRVQRAAAQNDVPDVSEDTEAQIEHMRGSGQNMPDSAREFFEPRFGQNFSGVNIHTGAQADALNREVDARAFTTGSDIFFRSGEYNPESSAGRELLAHELTHVVQQGGSEAQRKTEDCDGC